MNRDGAEGRDGIPGGKFLVEKSSCHGQHGMLFDDVGAGISVALFAL